MGRSAWLSTGIASLTAVAVVGAGALAVAAMAPSGGGAASAAATGSGSDPAITVTGTGEASGTPDQVLLTLTVETRARSTTAALDSMGTAATKVRNSLRRSGVAPADLGTTAMSLQPDYRYDNSGQHLIGYVASQNMSATLRSLRTAGQAVSDAVAAGGDATQVSSLSLAIDKDSALMRQARAKAFEAAKAKAAQYADLAGRGLGSVVRLTEVQTNPAQPVTADVRAAAAAAKPVPIEPGSQSLSVQVTASWAFR